MALPSRLRIFTWHTHGRYLQSLAQLDHDFFVPFNAERSGYYCGRGESYALPENVHEIPVGLVRELEFDCIIYQSRQQYEDDQHWLLNDQQRRAPRVYIEHDPPLTHPTEALHPVQDPAVLLVHVTPFNQLMWRSPGIETRVIEHGVVVSPYAQYSGEIPSGIVAVNNIATRGRRLGWDVVQAIAPEVPLRVVGLGSETIGGAGEIPPLELGEYESHYRFFLNPMRWTSLSMAVCEAMFVGMPILGLATTEMATVIRNGVEGYIETDVSRLAAHARRLINDPAEACALGAAARRRAYERFTIQRFVAEWQRALELVVAGGPAPAPASLEVLAL